MKRIRSHLPLVFILGIFMLFSTVCSDLVISKLDRQIDLSSQIVRTTVSLKVENNGNDAISEILLPFPEHQAKNLAFLAAVINEGKGKTKSYSDNLPINVANSESLPPSFTWHSITLPKALGKGSSLTLEVKAAFTHILRPFPEKITQADVQLVAFQDSAHFLSPYAVKVQSLTIKLPEPKVESYTKLENAKFSGSEIKYGPYENTPPFSYPPIVVHFVSNKPFSVAQELVHYQARPHVRGASAFRNLIAKLPPRAHSIYYRDEIGNISTSNVWSDSAKTLLEIEPRYPMFGGWRTSFTIGYGLPLKEFLFQSEGKRFLNISFGCPVNDVIVENLTVKVVLPEGSKYVSVSVPFPVKQSQEIKFSHLDMVGRPVIVLKKTNAVPEHNKHFQVYYRFSNLSLLTEPIMLIFGFFLFFVACIVYTHADFTISKSSPSYLAKLQWDEVQSTIQQFISIMNRCLTVHDKLEASLRDLSRTGDVQACKAARKAADVLLKELSKELKPLLTFLQSSPQAAQIMSKVEELVNKERELQEKLMLKHSTVVDAYEKKSGGRDIDNRISAVQQKITVLRQEVDDLLEVIDEI
ncbi:dolichyl-diphosphooligosaccharide--protein glycosyltransferase subunit 1a [Phtheirospermum japonicum]|uniref:Dolichyl-diphosphooligosaccharide--protein glycosyltransferase subunit 1 n=1 Tax=Phtheirospermum japonicum TaxID=374723 RepID=A0A830DJ70_9LAMI|nr:dolichyl-diphosphooligosaccharide--protein glycosyltransferase subunit 1a [Phtheirospermum japonicum]